MIRVTGRLKGATRPNGYITIICQLTPAQLKALEIFKSEEFNLEITRAQIPMFTEDDSHGE